MSVQKNPQGAIGTDQVAELDCQTADEPSLLVQDALTMLGPMFPSPEVGDVRLYPPFQSPRAIMVQRKGDIPASELRRAAEVARRLAWEDKTDVLVAIAPRPFKLEGNREVSYLGDVHVLWLKLDNPVVNSERATLPLDPSLLVATGHSGAPWYYGWALETPLPEAEYNRLVEALAEYLGESWHPIRANGMIRLAGTVNYDCPHIPGGVTVSSATGARYTAERLWEVVGPPPAVRARMHELSAQARQGSQAGGVQVDHARVDELALTAVGTAPPAHDDNTPHQDGEAAAPPVPSQATPPPVHSSAARGRAEEIANAPDILALFREELARAGHAGNPSNAELTFLALVSRLLPRPASLALKGPSSAGKNANVDAALRFFPESAYFTRTALSAKALFYSSESFEHRMLVLFEGEALKQGEMALIVRSLLSEGRLVYEYTDFEHKRTRVVDKPGPTGLITTTTHIHLDRELETRMLSASVADTPELTRAILLAIAAQEEGSESPVDYKPWHILQEQLEEVGGHARVPYARDLVLLVDHGAVRMRRDVTTLLAFVKAHALLHAATRPRDRDRAVLATLADYEAVHRLTAELVSEGLALSVSAKVRETVEAVRRIVTAKHRDDVTINELAHALGIHESNARRRAYECLAQELLRNRSQRGRQMLLTLGDPLPEDREALPTPAQLEDACARARTQA